MAVPFKDRQVADVQDDCLDERDVGKGHVGEQCCWCLIHCCQVGVSNQVGKGVEHGQIDHQIDDD